MYALFRVRLGPPPLYRPELRFDELPGLRCIICRNGYDNGFILRRRRYRRLVDRLIQYLCPYLGTGLSKLLSAIDARAVVTTYWSGPWGVTR